MKRGFAKTLLVAVAAGAAVSAASAQSLTTTFVSNNGGSAGGAVYFDLTVGASPITITGFDTNTSTTVGSTIGVQVYTHPGTRVGTTTNSALWNLQSTGTAVSAGTGFPSAVTLNNAIVLAPSTTYAVAIMLGAQAPAVAGAHRYTNGTGANQAYSNADLSLALGEASNVPWVSPIANRVWNGTVYYSLGGTLGACCLPNGSCISTTSANCTAQSGTYQGDDTLCVNVTCPQPPPGACCFANGTCTDVSTFACTAAGGVWQGAGTVCATANCPQPGACCFIDGTCSLLQSAACATQGGVFQGAGIACTAGLCPIVPPTSTPLGGLPVGTTIVNGSLAAGQVVWYSFTIPALATPMYLDIDTEGSALAPANDTEIGLYRSAGALEDTDDDDGSNLLSQLSYGNTSPRPAVGNGVQYNGRDGATLAAGTYYLAVAGFNSTFATTRWGVVSPSVNVGNFQVKLVLGNSVPTGACCAPAGTCSIITQVACATATGVYRGDGTDCATANCPQPGACCAPAGTCSILSSIQCAAASGIYRGDGTDCATANCPQPGACCLVTGTCSVIQPTACAAANGIYRGDGSVCATANCPAEPTVLYSNCNIKTGTVTLSGVGGLPAGSEWSECARDETDPFTANTNAGYTGNGAFRLADDFTVPAGGQYVGYVRLYAYTTGAAAPGVTAATLQILDGPPGGTANVVFGDETTNRLAANIFAPIYRIFSTVAPITGCTGTGTASGLTRHLQYVYVSVNQFLPAGTYWLNFAYTGASFSPPSVQADAIGRLCDPNNVNAMQGNAGVWAPIADLGQGCAPVSVPQDLFFDLLGQFGTTTCYANCDGSTTQPVLTVADFGCFLNEYAAGNSYANCDGSTTIPVLTVADFGCFLNAFAAGCS